MNPRSQRDPGATMRLISQNSVIVALIVLIIFGSIRYDHFLGLFNVLTVLRYNSMFALISLGMCFVIMSGGIDLSVGAVAALGSVVSALLSPRESPPIVAVNGKPELNWMMPPNCQPFARTAIGPDDDFPIGNCHK